MIRYRWAVLLLVGAAVGASLVLWQADRLDSAATGGDADAGVLRVLPLGDSITFGATEFGATSPGGYRGLLAERLRADGVTVSFVGTSTANPPTGVVDPAAFAHDGWSGARVDQIAEALVGDSALDGGRWLGGTPTRSGLVPDVVVVHLGTNDIGQSWDPGTTYAGGYTSTDPVEQKLFVAHLVERLHGLIDIVRASRPDAAIVLCTIVPMPDYPTAAPYNDALREVLLPELATDGAPVVQADVERAFLADPEAGGPDGVHPTPHGYATMAEVIAAAVRKLP